jgi:hypothetical protein
VIDPAIVDRFDVLENRAEALGGIAIRRHPEWWGFSKLVAANARRAQRFAPAKAVTALTRCRSTRSARLTSTSA